MSTGADLIQAIVNNQALMSIDNCPGVPVAFSKAVYGKVQDDVGSGTTIQPGANMQKEINTAVGFSGANSETAVWHFMVTGTAVHHFVVIPWYEYSLPNQGQVYTLNMAYENKYDTGDYVNGNPPAPPTGGTGYKTQWTVNQLSTMFSDLLTSATAWQDYFGNVGVNQANKITYWKYKVTTIDSAVINVNNYTGLD